MMLDWQPLMFGADSPMLDFIPPDSVRALRLTSKQLWQHHQQQTSSLQIASRQDISLLLKHRWPRVKQLKFKEASLNKDDVALLAEAKQTSLPALIHFGICQQTTESETVRQLASGQWLSLTSLDLSCALSEQPSQQLTACSWPQLTTLNISGNAFTVTAMGRLAKGQWASLQNLSLKNIALAVDSARCVQTGNWSHLTKLDLSHCFVEEYNPYHHAYLQLLSFRAGPIGAYRHIAAGKWPQLAVLNLSDNYIAAAEMAEFGRSDWPALRKLNLSCNTGHFVKELVSAHWTNLQELDLSCNVFLADDIQRLRHARWPQLTVLDLSGFSAPHVPKTDEHSHWMQAWLQAQMPSPVVKFCATQSSLQMASRGWHTLKWLDISSSRLAPEQVEILLHARGQSLDFLRVFCQALGNTDVRPEAGSWPRETVLHLEFLLDKHVLQSLSLGFWPAKKVIVRGPQHSTEVKTDPMDQLFSWDMPLMQHLYINFGFATELCAAGKYDPDESEDELSTSTPSFKPPTILLWLNRLSSAFWPALQVLDLSMNALCDAHILPFTSGQWPLLEKLCLDWNQLTLDGLKQLTRADWPVLVVLSLYGTGLDDIDADTKDSVFTTQTLLRLYKRTWPDLVVAFKFGDRVAPFSGAHKQTVTKLVDI